MPLAVPPLRHRRARGLLGVGCTYLLLARLRAAVTQAQAPEVWTLHDESVSLAVGFLALRRVALGLGNL